MNTAIALDPIISEFETLEQEKNHNAWLSAKLQAAIDDSRPSIPHDQAMASVEATLEKLRAARKHAKNT
jgi:hypothetical protein